MLPTQPGSAWEQEESHLDVGFIWMHTQIKNWCARNLEARAVCHGGIIGEGRGGTPQKHLIGKRCPDLAPARRQPPDKGTGPAELHVWGRAMLGRGESPFVPPHALCKPPAHCPSPLPSSPPPRPGAHCGPGPPPGLSRGYGTGCRGEMVCPRGCESQAMQLWCSTAQGPEGTRLSHATVIPSVAVTGNKQGQNTDIKIAGRRGKPHWQAPSQPPRVTPSWGCLRWDCCPSAQKGTDPGFACLPVNRQGLSWSPLARPWPSAPYALPLRLPPAQQERL